MKKVITLALMLSMVLVGNAQKKTVKSASKKAKPTRVAKTSSNNGKFSVEYAYSLEKTEGTNIGDLRLRYAITPKHAIRLSFGMTTDGEKLTKTTVTPRPTGSGVPNYTIFNESKTETLDTKNNSMRFGIGYEYSIVRTDKLNFYAGAEFAYGTMSAEGTYTSSDINDKCTVDGDWTTNSNVRKAETTTYKDWTGMEKASELGTTGTNKFAGSSITGNLVLGFDYNLYKGLYAGAELALGVNAYSYDKGYYTSVKEDKNEFSHIESRRQFGSGNNNVHTSSSSTTTYNSESGFTHVIANGNTSTSTGHSVAFERDNETKFHFAPRLKIGYTF